MKPQCGFLEDLNALPFSQIYPIQKHLYIDVTNQLGFGHQTIYTFSPFKSSNEKTIYININHSSIDSFLEKLSKQNWKDDEGYNDLFDTLYQPGSDTTTLGIRIRATAKHIPMDYNNTLGQNFYSYSVRISANNMPENKKYKLTKRKWIITQDINPQEPQIVEGPGIIGYYPEIYQGCQDFIYQSCSVMEGYKGYMCGFFQFQDLKTKELIEAQINPFPLRPDQDQKLICFNLETKQSEIIF